MLIDYGNKINKIINLHFKKIEKGQNWQQQNDRWDIKERYVIKQNLCNKQNS